VLTKEINPSFKFAILTVPGSVLLIWPSYADPINLPKMMILIPFTLTAVLLLISLRNYGSQRTFTLEIRLMILLYSLLGISMVLTGFLGSQNYIRVLFGATGRNNGLIYYISAILLSVVILRLSIGLLELDYLNSVLSWTSLAFLAYCMIQFIDLDPVSWANPYNRVIGTLGNPNFSASALACFAVFWFYKFYRSRDMKPIKRLLLVIPAGVMFFLSWSTQSLQGLIVFALGIGLILYIFAREKWSSRSIPLLFFVGGGISLLFLFASFLGFGPFGSSLEQYTLKLRGWYALFGIQAMLNSPWLGVGVDNYISAFRTFKSDEFVSQYGSVLSSNNAHSTPVQIGSSFGLVVFFLYCIIQFWILLKALSVLSSRNSGNSRLKPIALMWILFFSQSLLSIEIIGLGVMNWVLGAVILSSSQFLDSPMISNDKNAKKVKKALNYPVWAGPIALSTFCLGAFTAIPISIEDKAFQNLSLYQVTDENSKRFAAENFNKLSSFTLYYPEKLDRVLQNMYLAGLSSELDVAVRKLYEVEAKNAQAADLLATHYKNTNQYLLEVQIRENLRNLDPWNEKLELALAQSYLSVRDKEGLRASVDRLRDLNPSSPELQEALSLLDSFENIP